jgi:4-hydroxy-tetrahydrodipicolinate synthase
MNQEWAGIFPALTTKFRADFTLDLSAMKHHIAGQIAAGVDGIVVLGSLGENATLTTDEKIAVIRCAVEECRGRIPVLSGVIETSTAMACEYVRRGADAGAEGFMLLPAMQYVSDRRETLQHLRTVARAATRPIMLYNNPVSYRIDITPEMFAELADEPKFIAIKESSDDVRRITDIQNLVGGRYRIFTGVDDLAMESLMIGAIGWVAGLVCAFPTETVALYRLLKARRFDDALQLYRWFTPLLHLDVSIKFVQNIKLAEALTGTGSEIVRPPRLPLTGTERADVERVVARALQARPEIPVLNK